ncbi:MAG TPA: M28 family metallopeptidase [Candidatus Acidoferrales bacterium]|nr:M28 family metallopeptidase [Candidatus Acidoferrales bacterium]
MAALLAMAKHRPAQSPAGNDSAIAGFIPSRVAQQREIEQRLQAIPDPARAEADIRYLTRSPHMAGTEASHRVAEWLLGKYRSYGFDARIVTYKAWLPLPREIKLEITAPVRRTLGTPEQPISADQSSSDPRAAVGFNSYSPSGQVTAPVVYVNYGTQEDYEELDALGVSVRGKIVLARYGRGYRGIKAKLAEERKAAALILYSDPSDDGYEAGRTYPRGPWRPASGIQRGSILYTQLYPGDPLSPAINGTQQQHISPADAASLPHIPTMPISAEDARVILENLGGKPVPDGWQGGLPFGYRIGPGAAKAHLKIEMDYQERPIYDVIATLPGANDNQWVVLGNHHDAWVFGAADPASGTAVMLETARALGDLARSGWKPRRTIVMCEWDGEEPGLLGSTEWVEANRAELQAKAVAYINVDVGITGSNFAASATPSLDHLVRDVTREVQDPDGAGTVYQEWAAQTLGAPQASGDPAGSPKIDTLGDAPLGGLGAGSDFCPFLDYAGIPSVDMGFQGDYGVYHSIYDDFRWMKRFGDPGFRYHAALARVLGTLALRLDEAGVLPYGFSDYAAKIAAAEKPLVQAAAKQGEAGALDEVTAAVSNFSDAAARASRAMDAIPATLDPDARQRLNRELAGVEQQLLSPEGLIGRPWYKHTIYAPGMYAGYAAEMLPGINDALSQHDAAALQREANALTAALRRAAARLDEISQFAPAANPLVVDQHLTGAGN